MAATRNCQAVAHLLAARQPPVALLDWDCPAQEALHALVARVHSQRLPTRLLL